MKFEIFFYVKYGLKCKNYVKKVLIYDYCRIYYRNIIGLIFYDKYRLKCKNLVKKNLGL